jgi:hypothetical protein
LSASTYLKGSPEKLTEKRMAKALIKPERTFHLPQVLQNFEIHAAKNLGGEGQTPPNGYSIIV